jgi:hypothetical protein
VKHAILWRKKKYIRFFQVYCNIQRCFSFVSLQKQKKISQISKGTLTSTSLWCGFHEVLTKKEKKRKGKKEIAVNICLLILFESMSSLCPCYIYVHRQQRQGKPVGLGLAWSDESYVHLLMRDSAPVLGGSTSFRVQLGPAVHRLFLSSIQRLFPAEAAHLKLWLISCLGFVVRVAVQVSEQRLTVGQSICWQ